MGESHKTPGGLWVVSANDSDQDGDDDFRSPDARNVFAHFGLAYYCSEVMTHGLVNALVVSRLIMARAAATKLLKDPWDKAFRDTLGTLVERAGKHVKGNDPLIESMQDAVARRNDLAHRFWRNHAENFVSERGRAAMIDELCEMRELFERIDKEFAEEVVSPLLDKLGVSPEMIEAHVGGMLESAKVR